MTMLLLQSNFKGLFGRTDIFGRDTMDYDNTRAISKTAAPKPLAFDVNAGTNDAPKKRRHLEGTSDERKTFPIASGVLDYFPDAIAEVSLISYLGNLKHNPGQPLHWARGKSMDHADCIARHLIERGGYETVIVDGKEYRMRHSASLVWRALANLQQELEQEFNLAPPRNAR